MDARLVTEEVIDGIDKPLCVVRGFFYEEINVTGVAGMAVGDHRISTDDDEPNAMGHQRLGKLSEFFFGFHDSGRAFAGSMRRRRRGVPQGIWRPRILRFSGRLRRE